MWPTGQAQPPRYRRGQYSVVSGGAVVARVHAVDGGLPVDPDVTLEARPFAALHRGRAARGRLDVVGVVFLGGCLGGATRYAVVRAWPTHPT